MTRLPRIVALALAGLALTASITACGGSSRMSAERLYEQRQGEDAIATYEVGRIREREADTRRIVQDEIARQRRP